MATHAGGERDIDRTYGALAEHVARQAIGVEGPLREHYVVDHHDTDDAGRWRTEIGWPVFQVSLDRDAT